MKKAFLKGIVVMVLLFGSLGLTGCGLLYSLFDEPETGTWKKGSICCGVYSVTVEGPYSGAPSYSDWSTYCKLEDGTKVYVEFYGKEDSLEGRIAEVEAEGITVSEGILWDNSCYFYYDEEEEDGEPITIVLFEVWGENYLEVEFSLYEDEILPFEEIPDTFTLTI